MRNILGTCISGLATSLIKHSQSYNYPGLIRAISLTKTEKPVFYLGSVSNQSCDYTNEGQYVKSTGE